MSISEGIISFFKEPEEAKPYLFPPLYVIKKGIAVVAYFTNGPIDWATVGQQINDYILPFFAKLANCCEAFSRFSKPFSQTFNVVGLFEHWNDANYFINGEAYEDLINFRVASIAAHILSIAVHWISTAVFLKAVNLANVIGDIRIFSWIAQASAYLQNLPLLKSIPNIASAGKYLSHVRVFKWIPALAVYGGVADKALIAVNVLQAADGLHRYFASRLEIKELEEEYIKLLVTKHKFTYGKNGNINSLLIEKKITNIAKLSFEELNSADQSFAKINKITKTNQLELGRLRVNLLNEHNKKFQATVDIISAIAQLVLQVALLVGLTCLGGICALGIVALVAVGVSLYYKATLTKPDLESVLLNV